MRENTVQKKGSKGLREILTKNSKALEEKNLPKLTQVVTFLKLTGSANIEPTRLRGMIGAWNNSYLPGNIRTFLFKFYNNILGLNVRVSKFNPLIDPSCTFCSNRNFRPAERESFAHLFFYCETTQVILAEFFKRYFTINVPEISVFFCGTVSNKERKNRAFQLTLDVFRYHIWLNKLEKKTPVLSNILLEINDSLGTIYESSKILKQDTDYCNFFRRSGEE